MCLAGNKKVQLNNTNGVVRTTGLDWDLVTRDPTHPPVTQWLLVCKKSESDLHFIRTMRGGKTSERRPDYQAWYARAWGSGCFYQGRQQQQPGRRERNRNVIKCWPGWVVVLVLGQPGIIRAIGIIWAGLLSSSSSVKRRQGQPRRLSSDKSIQIYFRQILNKVGFLITVGFQPYKALQIQGLSTSRGESEGSWCLTPFCK